jgi:hypothetical protein
MGGEEEMRSSIAGLVAFSAIGATSFGQDTPQPPANQASPETSKSTVPPLPNLEWKFGEYNLKFGGYVKLDAIHDFNQIGSTNSFDPRTIPVRHDPTVPDNNTELTARQTRLFADVTGPMHVYVEGDFAGTGDAFRLRHAYGEFNVDEGDKLLGGQTWTTFMDSEAMPETLDFESPTAFPQIRTAQARFTHDLGNGNYVAFSVEDPENDVIQPAGVVGTTSQFTPDLDGAFNWNFEQGHVHAGAWTSGVRFDNANGTTENHMLWGLNVATKIKTVGKDNAIGQITYGDGVGRFRGGDVAAINGNGNLVGIYVFAIMGSYQHYWSDDLRSTIVYSWAGGDSPNSVPADTTERTSYFAVNLIWQFMARAWTGLEVLHGSRSTIGQEYGGDYRVQASLKFDF